MTSDLGGVWLFRIGCRFAFVQARLRHVFCLRTGALFFSFRGSKGATSHPCEWPFSASPELGFRWCLAVSDPLPRGCRFAFGRFAFASRFLSTYWLGLSSSPLGVPKVPLRTPENDRFLPRLSSDLGGVWLFRIHCQEAAVLRLSKLGCVTFFVYVLGLSSSPLGVPKVPLRTPANDRFLPRLSSDLGGVWLFRIHCQEAAVLRLSKLGCVTSPPFSASPELGFRWCLAVSDPLPRGCRFAFVQARLRHVFCLRTGALFFSFRGSKGATSHPCEWPFSASPELGFRWCLAVSDPLPRGCRFAFVQARLRHVFCLRTGALFFSFRGSKGATSHPCEWPFSASPELGFRWCLAVSDRLPFCVCQS